jgi:hypothetical protein
MSNESEKDRAQPEQQHHASHREHHNVLPTVTAISPNAGKATGGESVILSGSGFTDAKAVKFGANDAASYHVDNDSQITANSPAGSGTVPVTVTAPGDRTSATSSATQFKYVPVVTAIGPASGTATGGDSVSITGCGFTGFTAVNFGTTPALSPKLVSDSQITATSPAGSGTVHVTVTCPSGTSATSSDDEFSNIPVVAAVWPASGSAVGGEIVFLTGCGFTDAKAVKFGTNDAASYHVDNDSQITATSPVGSGTIDVTVLSCGESSGGCQFKYNATVANAFEISFNIFCDTASVKLKEVKTTDFPLLGDLQEFVKKYFTDLALYDVSCDTPGPKPIGYLMPAFEGQTSQMKLSGIFPARNGLAFAKFPQNISYKDKELDLACNEFVFDAREGKRSSLQVSYLTKLAALRISACDYSKAAKQNHGDVETHRPFLSGVSVQLFRGNAIAESASYSVTTSAFPQTISDVPPGEYVYEVSPPPGYDSSMRGRANISVASGDLFPLHFCFKPSAATLYGEILLDNRNSDINGKVTLLGSTSDNSQLSRFTDVKNGAFRFDGVPLGTFQVGIEQLTENGKTVDKDRFETVAQQVKVTTPGLVQMPTISIIPQEIQDIKVSVTDEQGQPLAGERVELLDRSGKFISDAISDPTGTVVFSPNVRGIYYLKFKNGDQELQQVEV